MNLLSFAFVDTAMFGATLTLKYARHFGADDRREMAPGSPHHDTQCIALRGPADPDPANWQADVEHVDYPLFGEWTAARNIVARAENEIARHLGMQNAVLGKVLVVTLKPGGAIDWHTDEGGYAETHVRFHLPVLPCAGAVLHSGGETLMPGVGNLTYFNNRVLHSAVNLGPVPRVHLIIDVRKPVLQ